MLDTRDVCVCVVVPAGCRLTARYMECLLLKELGRTGY